MRVISSARSCAMFVGFAALALGACSVPEKQQVTPDAAVDAPPSQPPPPDGAVDTDAPDTKLDQVPDPFSHSSQAIFRFSSNDPTATFMCRVDTDSATACVSPFLRTLPDGPHSFSVRAVDAAGNSDDTPAEKVWTIDTVAPETQLLTGPPSADNSVMVVFTFRSAEANVTFECSLDSGAFAPCTSGGTFGPVGNGAHAFAVRARDRAGNIDPTPAGSQWTVDTSTPDTQIQTSPPDADSHTSTTFMFFSPDAGMGATFQCALDAGAFAACTSPRVLSSLTEGAHTFSVRVRDAFGNVDPSPATRSWTVDLTPPTTTITAGPTGTVPVASASITFTANETNVTFQCRIDTDTGPFVDCMSPFALTALGQGAHKFEVRATDAAGHTDASAAARTWTVDTVAPDVSITVPAAGTSGPRVIFTFTANEGVVACSLDSAPFAACVSPTGTNLPAGPHQFAVRATDTAGNVTTVTRPWTVACNPPNATDAVGLLHLDDTGQTLANAVTGGAPAMLGDTAMAELIDPTEGPGGRFGGALVFNPAEGDHVAWPLAVPVMPAMFDLTIELWSKPGATAGPHDIAVSGDGRIALRVTGGAMNTVVYSMAIAEGGMMGMTRVVSSAAVAAGPWHHVLVSLQQPALRLWVDGARTQFDGVQLAAPLALDSLRLGGTGPAAYDGILDEVWVTQTAISTDEAARVRYCPL